MSSRGLIEIGEAVSDCHSLRVLDVSHNHLDDKAALVFARVVAFNHRLKRLLVEGNPFGTIGMDALARTMLGFLPSSEFDGWIDFGRAVPQPAALVSAVYSLCDAVPLSELHASFGSPLLLDMRDIWQYTIAVELFDAMCVRKRVRFEARSPATRALVDFATFDSPNTFESLHPLGVLVVTPTRTDPPAVPPLSMDEIEFEAVRRTACGVQFEAQREMLLSVICRNRMLKGTQPSRLLALLESKLPRVSMAAQMVRAYDPTARLDWVRSALDSAEQLELMLAHGWHAFEPLCPTGHYCLDLSKSVHVRIASCLQLLNARDVQERLARARQPGVCASPFQLLCGCKLCALWPADTTLFGGTVGKTGALPGDCWRHATIDERPLLPDALVPVPAADEPVVDRGDSKRGPIALPKADKTAGGSGVSAWKLPSEGVLDVHYVASCSVAAGSMPLQDSALHVLLADVVSSVARTQLPHADPHADEPILRWAIALRERCAGECFSCKQVGRVLDWAEQVIGGVQAAALQEEIVVILFRRLVSYVGFERLLARLPNAYLANVRRRLGVLNILAELLLSTEQADVSDPLSLNIDALVSSYTLDASVREERCALVWLLSLSQQSPRHCIEAACVDGEAQVLPPKWIKSAPREGVISLAFAMRDDNADPTRAKRTSVAYAPGY
jgi:hypothetical protein